MDNFTNKCSTSSDKSISVMTLEYKQGVVTRMVDNILRGEC